MTRTALENDNVRSQKTSARYNSLFNWTPKMRDVSDVFNHWSEDSKEPKPKDFASTINRGRDGKWDS